MKKVAFILTLVAAFLISGMQPSFAQNKEKKNIDIEAAEEYVVDTDEKRFNLISTFLDKKPLNLDFLFDATINRNAFTIHETAELIAAMYEKKVVRQIAERKKIGSL